MNKKRIAIAVAATAMLVAVLCGLALRGRQPLANGGEEISADGLAPSRPAPAAPPKESPLRPRPDFTLSIPHVSDGESADAVFENGPEEVWDDDDESGEPDPEILSAPVLRDDDPALASMASELAFSQSVRDALAKLGEGDELRRESARLLDSERPEDRALAGVLLFFLDELSGKVLDDILDDEDMLVPLIVCDWIRDNGSETEAEDFKAAFAARDYSAEDFRDFAMVSAGLPGGGRSALDAFLSLHAEDGVPVEDLAGIVASTNASYDVREQALFKLLEPETRKEGEAALDAFAAGLTPASGGLDPFFASKMAELAQVANADGDEEKIWDAESAVVVFLSQTEGGLQARDLANYLEYALHRDDPEFPPVIEEGTWEFANEFLLAARDRMGELPQADADALDRIAVSLDRLAEYDPALNPFETLEDDDDDDDGSFEDEEDGDDWEEDDSDDGDFEEEDFEEDFAEEDDMEEDEEDSEGDEDDWEEDDSGDEDFEEDDDEEDPSEDEDWEEDDFGEDDDEGDA